MIGIDVSKHNGNVDFKKVKEDGYDFVIIRAGFGKSTRDSNFDENIKKALSAGLKVGAYWFVYAKTSNDLLGNVKMAHAVLNNHKSKLSMGVWCDYEYDSDRYVERDLSVKERTAWVKSFVEGMKSYGYDCGIYANPDYLENKFGNLKSYKLWLANYTEKKDNVEKYKPYIWQYTNKGKVNGISGNVDIDRVFEESKEEPKCYGIVTTNGSNLMLRAGNSTKDTIIAKIPNKTKIEIIKKFADWYFVKYDDKQGYAFSKYIKEVK